MPGWFLPPQVLSPSGTSEEIHKFPWVSMKTSSEPCPRLRVGFQLVARPVTASISPIPGRDTQPVPHESWPLGLFAHRSWPLMYTLPVRSAMTVYSESPPVLLTQIAGWFELELEENFATASHSVAPRKPVLAR